MRPNLVYLCIFYIFIHKVLGGNPTAKPTKKPISPTGQPTGMPSDFPTTRPTAAPTVTKNPTPLPSSEPTGQPSDEPTRQPSRQPSVRPSEQPTNQPTSNPSAPTGQPTIMPTSPTHAPTHSPTRSFKPTVKPTSKPVTGVPTFAPSYKPTAKPTAVPTATPTHSPSARPTNPTAKPTAEPSAKPTAKPTRAPTTTPTRSPTSPTIKPTVKPSVTSDPTFQPTPMPSADPTTKPTTYHPTVHPTLAPTYTFKPTVHPSSQPTGEPSTCPSVRPTSEPTYSRMPSSRPTMQPSRQPTTQPTGQPSRIPSMQPTSNPSSPTGQPSTAPSRQPTRQPSTQPTKQPACRPTSQPSGRPTASPSIPTSQPSGRPTRQPSCQPTSKPTNSHAPSSRPTACPTTYPSGHPSTVPTSYPTRSFRPTVLPSSLPSSRPSSEPSTWWTMTEQPTNHYFQVNVTGSANFEPYDIAYCVPLELQLNMIFRKRVYVNDLVLINTPGLTSGPCTSPVNGQNITGLTMWNGTIVNAKFIEGSYWNNYADSKIMLVVRDLFLDANKEYLFRIDRSNNLKRTCVHNTTWVVSLAAHPNITKLDCYTNYGKYFACARFNIQGSLVLHDDQPKKCYAYNTSLVFFPPYQQLNIGINFTFIIPFTLQKGDYITVHLPGFTNRIQDYPLNNMISANDTAEIVAGADATWSNFSYAYSPFNLTLAYLTYNTDYEWVAEWHEGNITSDLRMSKIVFYPQDTETKSKLIWISFDSYKNHIITECGRPRNYTGFKVDFYSASGFYINESIVTQSSAIGTGCNEFNNCNGNGNCDYCKSMCICFDGYGSESDKALSINKDFKADCSSRSCPVGPALFAMPTTTVEEGYHRNVECSNSGVCDRVTGACDCFDGFYGSACEKIKCPGTPACSGRGQCFSMKQLAASSVALPLNNATVSYENDMNSMNTSTWDAGLGYACVCDSSWTVGLGYNETQQAEFFGPSCEMRRCPSGDDPFTKSVDETDCSGKVATTGTGGHPGAKGNLCHVDCSNRGVCDYQTGVCTCFEGLYGSACNLLVP